jgi:hypothetical protein
VIFPSSILSMSNLAYRSLRVAEGQIVSVAFKWESLWLIPEPFQ